MPQKLYSLHVCVGSVLSGFVMSCVSLAKLCVHVPVYMGLAESMSHFVCVLVHVCVCVSEQK